MSNCRLVFLAGLLCSLAASAQDSTSRSSYFDKLVPRHAIKWSPFHAASFFPTFQLAYEWQVAKQATVQVEFGTVLKNWAFDFFRMDEYRDKKGFKAKVEGRYYHAPFAYTRSIRYVSAEPYWTDIAFNRREYIVECLDRDCVSRYSRRYDYGVDYREKGLAVKYGVIVRAAKLMIDLQVGIRFRYIDFNVPVLPPPAQVPVDDFFFEGREPFGRPNEKSRFAVSPTAGLRVGYAF